MNTTTTLDSPTAPVRPACFEVRPIAAPLGAEVLGLGLRQPLSDDDFARPRGAHLEHQVLVFRDPHLTPAQQVAFSQRLGRPQCHVLHQFALHGQPEVLIVSNIIEGGGPQAWATPVCSGTPTCPTRPGPACPRP